MSIKIDKDKLFSAIGMDLQNAFLNAITSAYSKSLYILQPLTINAGEVFVVPENVIIYASDVYIEGEIFIDSELRLI